MFEAEIMIAGYTTIVATGAVGATKIFYDKKIKKLNQEVDKLKSELRTLQHRVKQQI
tara:strand:- start:224 stop:394 length:171 start_codon:yes stop_codon:yes gene_type:complete